MGEILTMLFIFLTLCWAFSISQKEGSEAVGYGLMIILFITLAYMFT